MKSKNRISILSILLVILFGLSAQAQMQNVTATSGGNFDGASRSISFTIGEPVVGLISAGDVIVTQGFLQPHLIVTAINEMKGMAFQIQAFPNPTTDYVNIATNTDLPAGSSWQLYDLKSRILASGLITGNQTEISVEAYTPAVYILKINTRANTLKAFKIIKK